MKVSKRKSKRKPKINHRIFIREKMINDGAYDGRFKNRTQELKKHKKPKHKILHDD